MFFFSYFIIAPSLPLFSPFFLSYSLEGKTCHLAVAHLCVSKHFYSTLMFQALFWALIPNWYCRLGPRRNLSLVLLWFGYFPLWVRNAQLWAQKLWRLARVTELCLVLFRFTILFQRLSSTYRNRLKVSFQSKFMVNVTYNMMDKYIRVGSARI